MTGHRQFDDLSVKAIDGPLTPLEADVLERHLRDCPDCRHQMDAYGSDAAMLSAIALAPPPAWVKAAIFAAPTRPRTPRSTWVAVLATIALLAALLVAGIVATSRQTRISATPIGTIEWLTTDAAARLVGSTTVGDAWLLAVADETGTRTAFRIFRPETGWTGDPDFDTQAADAATVMSVGPSSDGLNTFMFENGRIDGRPVVVTRDDAGRWERQALTGIGGLVDLAVRGTDVWVLAAPEIGTDTTRSELVLLSSRSGYEIRTGPPEVRNELSAPRIGATRGSVVVAGCSRRVTTGCGLTIYRSTDQGSTWAKASLPHAIDLRTPLGPEDDDPSTPSELAPQLVALEDRFAILVPGPGGGTEIWESTRGDAWDVAGAFPAPPFPVAISRVDDEVIGLGGRSGQAWVWSQGEPGSWTLDGVDIGEDLPVGTAAAGDRSFFLLALRDSTPTGWRFDLRR